jgi:FHS family L-fucose permease-like MFS transporter
MPRLQGGLIDGDGMTLFGMALESVRVSFFLPVICFVVIAAYGFMANRVAKAAQE